MTAPTPILASRQLRLAVIPLLQAITGLVDNVSGVPNVESPGEGETAPKDYPQILVATGSDNKVPQQTGQTNFTTTVTVDVLARVRHADSATSLANIEALAAKIEVAVIAGPSFINFLQKIAGIRRSMKTFMEGEEFVSEAYFQFDCETYEVFDPTELNPDAYPMLADVGIHIDTGTPFDATGTYPYPAFPASVLPAPRTSGPDGRDEAYILLDPSTGLPPANPAPRPIVVGQDLIFPDGSSINQKRGWSWGRPDMARESDAQDAVDQGANIIRIKIPWWGNFTSGATDGRDDSRPEFGYLSANALTALDNQVAWCVARNLPFVLFIDSDCGQNSLQDGNPGAELSYCMVGAAPGFDDTNGRNFLTDLTQRAIYKLTWEFVAHRFKNTPGWALAEITPELNWASGVDQDYEDYYRELAAAIRLVAPGIPFLVGAPVYSMSNCLSAYDGTQDDFVYTGNLYVRSANPDPIADLNTRLVHLVNMRTNRNCPVWIQQLGVTSGEDLTGNVYLQALCDLLVTNNIGGAMWTYRDGNSSNGFGQIWTDNQGVDHVKTDRLAIIEAWFAA